MTTRDDSTYYTKRKRKLLRKYDRYAVMARKHLAGSYGEGFADEVLADTRQRFEAFLPELPYIGGKDNQFTDVMEINGWIISFYRAMKERDKTVEEVVSIGAKVSDEYFATLPGWVVAIAKRVAFSWLVKRRMRSQAALSQERRYSEDFVYTVEETPDGWTLVLTECAVNKLYDKLGITELKPYCNFFDVTYSRYLDMGIDATQTIGLGHDTCRLCYRRGKETVIPERLVGLLPRTRES